MKTKQEIILLHYRDKLSERSISRKLKVHRKTVRKYLSQHAVSQQSDAALSSSISLVPSYNIATRGKRKLTAAITSCIDDFLSTNELRCLQGQSKQQLKSTDIFDKLIAKGYDISYRTVCNYVKTQRKKTREAFIKQTYAPGDICEFDWGEVKLYLSGEFTKLQMAVFTMAYSNYRYAVLFHNQDTLSFQQSHVDFFNHLQVIPNEMVYDNMRTVVKSFVGDKEPTDGLSALMCWYHFHHRFCNARKGNEKGHVEKSVEYIRRKSFSIDDSFETLAQANAHLATMCHSLNQKNLSKGEHTPQALFDQEKPGMLPYTTAFSCSDSVEARVDKYATVSYKNKRYSVADHLVGEFVFIKATSTRIACYYKNELVGCHARSYGKEIWHLDLNHYLKTLLKKPGALTGSLAFKQAHASLQDIYSKHFKTNKKDFAILLLRAKEKGISAAALQDSVKKIEKITTISITSDMILMGYDNQLKGLDPCLESIPGQVISEIDRQCVIQLELATSLMNHQGVAN